MAERKSVNQNSPGRLYPLFPILWNMEQLILFLFHIITSSSSFFLIINNLVLSIALWNAAPVKNSTTYFSGTRWNMEQILPSRAEQPPQLTTYPQAKHR
jgi:hypothetical protein